MLALPYLQGHLDEHQQLLDADPDPLPFELLSDAGALFIGEASQQLKHNNEEEEELPFASYQGACTAHHLFSKQVAANNLRVVMGYLWLYG